MLQDRIQKLRDEIKALQREKDELTLTVDDYRSRALGTSLRDVLAILLSIFGNTVAVLISFHPCRGEGGQSSPAARS